MHGLIREAQDTIPSLRQYRISRGVLRLTLSVSGTIEFDSEAALSAAEIEDKRSDGMLPAKLEAFQPPAA